MFESPPAPRVYQLRVSLQGVSPMVWRRLLVRSDSTIADLHRILQIAFGWSDDHLHCFRIHGKEYGIPHVGGMGFDDDATTIRLAHFRFRVRERFVYEYNFSAHWVHEIRVEQLRPLTPSGRYPLCIGGARAAPPESCGGPWAYLQLLDHHTSHVPYEALEIVATALDDFLRSGEEQALGDRDELQEAFLELHAYQQFTPGSFARQRINVQLRTLHPQEGAHS
jgi:Plasmid pRiA4b ORF-3-like protein